MKMYIEVTLLYKTDYYNCVLVSYFRQSGGSQTAVKSLKSIQDEQARQLRSKQSKQMPRPQVSGLCRIYTNPLSPAFGTFGGCLYGGETAHSW